MMNKTHLMPIFSVPCERLILNMLFGRYNMKDWGMMSREENSFVNLKCNFSVMPCSFPHEFVGYDIKFGELKTFDSSIFTVSNIIKTEGSKKGEVFEGSFFYNTDSLFFDNFSAETDFKAYAIGFSFADDPDNTPLFIVPFPEPLPINGDKILHRSQAGTLFFTFPPKSIVSHFGWGTYTPGIEEMMKAQDNIGQPGCPFQNPESCNFYKKNERCGLLREDKICKAVASMSGTSKPHLASTVARSGK